MSICGISIVSTLNQLLKALNDKNKKLKGTISISELLMQFSKKTKLKVTIWNRSEAVIFIGSDFLK